MSLSNPTKFPEIWDNTLVSMGADCGMKLNYRGFHHLTPNANNIDLHAGASFAKAIEVMRVAKYTPGRELPSADAPKLYGARALMQAYGNVDPGDNVKSVDRVLGAFEDYMSQYDPDKDHVKPAILAGKPAVEFNFSWPIDVLHPVTGQPIIYTGRFDMLGHLNGDDRTMFVVDEKTTKQLGATWPRQWTLRSQFMGYVWGARKYGHPVKGAIIRGISILKTQYGHAEAIVYFSDKLLDTWYSQLCERIERWKRMWEGKELWDYNFGSVCSQYGGCPYRMLCESDNPDAWLDPHYRVDPWDPAKIKHDATE